MAKLLTIKFARFGALVAAGILAIYGVSRFFLAYGELQILLTNLVISYPAYAEKSGSLKHDAKLSVLVNSNIIQINKHRESMIGNLAFGVAVRSDKKRKLLLTKIDYLDQ